VTAAEATAADAVATNAETSGRRSIRDIPRPSRL
jgi:hypothetical protein